MTVEEVTQPEGWDKWIIDNRFGDILQTWEWGEVRKGEMWNSLRVQVMDGEEIVVRAQILIRKMPMGMRLYYLPRGPILDYSSSKAAEGLRTLLDWTREHANQHRGLRIKLGPAVSEMQVPQISNLLTQLGLRPSFQAVQSQHTFVVDLQPTEMEILQLFDKDTRNLVRRSAREGVMVDKYIKVEDHKGLRTFHNLYLAAADNGRFVPRPWSYFARLWEIMAPLGMARVYIASFEDKPLAGNLVLTLGARSYQLWAGSRRDEPKKFATYALQWAAMQDLKADGITSYDMWGRAPDADPKHPWAGISLFKKGFGGEAVSYIGDYDLPLSPTYPLFTTADKLRKRIMTR
jgi:lipid II:glycine glycyltransferase (peptidoglycan interpeptide bridge formation enzyme)